MLKEYISKSVIKLEIKDYKISTPLNERNMEPANKLVNEWCITEKWQEEKKNHLKKQTKIQNSHKIYCERQCLKTFNKCCLTFACEKYSSLLLSYFLNILRDLI